MMERWSYKPEVEGLSPSLGTNCFNGLSGRDSFRQNGDCRNRGVRRGASASRPGHTFKLNEQSPNSRWWDS